MDTIEEMKGNRSIVMAAVQQTRLPTSPPRSYLTPSLVAGAGRKHLPDVTPKPQTKWKTIREQIHEHAESER